MFIYMLFLPKDKRAKPGNLPKTILFVYGGEFSRKLHSYFSIIRGFANPHI
jgi:hypothetical protein